MNKKFLVSSVALYTLLISLSACNSSSEKNTNSVATKSTDELYFSSTQFITDQWNINKLQPYVILRVINEDGKSDSTYINQDETIFKEFSKYFVAADIAKSNLLDKYEYSENFDDPYNSKVKAVYIETIDDGWFNSTSQKILYTVEKGAFIQEYTKTMFSSLKERKMAYLYKY